MKRSLLVLLVVLLAGCGLLPKTVDETQGWSAQRLYAEAKDQLNSGGYEKAIKYFETLEARYPYGRYAQQAQLEVAYAYYKDNEPVSAIAACDRFIKLHPEHPNVDYAYYLRGLANFTEDQGLLSRIGDQDMTDRDPKAAGESFDSFQQLVTRFPKSKYTPDALARMKYLVDALASHEVHVALYYYKRGAYVAASNRAQYAIEHYPNSPAIEQALAILVKSYDKMGINDLRDDALRVLQKNFPKSKYVAGDFDKSKPWWRFWQL
ncbi:MAG: outer membrane protein assembly factor BamD [Sulfuriferula sp.]|jgi:outer membrane protein assembly factor BamD